MISSVIKIFIKERHDCAWVEKISISNHSLDTRDEAWALNVDVTQSKTGNLR